MSIAENIRHYKSELPSNVKLVAVSKFKPVEDLTQAYNAGQRVFGENRPQEFAAKVQALPKDKDHYRLYVLGDKDQLPSVEAGAVLGEILGLDKSSVVELTESNRFDNNSKIGRLSRFIQKRITKSR